MRGSSALEGSQDPVRPSARAALLAPRIGSRLQALRCGNMPLQPVGHRVGLLQPGLGRSSTVAGPVLRSLRHGLGDAMLIEAIETYLSLRQSLGFKLRDAARNLRAYGRFASARGDDCVRAQTVFEWAATAPSPRAWLLTRPLGDRRHVGHDLVSHPAPPEVAIRTHLWP